jgi:hypothetical protein
LQGSHGRMSGRSHRQRWRRLSVIEPNDNEQRSKRADQKHPRCLSRRSAVVTPANPPPKMTTWVTFSGQEIAWTGDSGPRKYWASSRIAWDRIPRKKQDNSQQINAGKSALISSAAHCGCCPLTNGRRMTLMVAQKGNPSAAQVIARSMAEPQQLDFLGGLNVIIERNPDAESARFRFFHVCH